MQKDTTLKGRLLLMERLFALSQRESIDLIEKLKTNSLAGEILGDALSDYGQKLKAQITAATNSRLLEPRVTATIIVNDDTLEGVDVTLWFAWAREEDLREVLYEAYDGDFTAEQIIPFLLFFDLNIERAYVLAGSERELSCRIDQQQAEAWLAAHRPTLLP